MIFNNDYFNSLNPDFAAPQLGQTHVFGICSKDVPGLTPLPGSPFAGSFPFVH
jgi:hypothetical protein